MEVEEISGRKLLIEDKWPIFAVPFEDMMIVTHDKAKIRELREKMSRLPDGFVRVAYGKEIIQVPLKQDFVDAIKEFLDESVRKKGEPEPR